MKRGAISKKGSQLISFWLPHSVAAQVEQAVDLEDSDRSKFVRRAVREKLERLEKKTVAK